MREGVASYYPGPAGPRLENSTPKRVVSRCPAPRRGVPGEPPHRDAGGFGPSRPPARPTEFPGPRAAIRPGEIEGQSNARTGPRRVTLWRITGCRPGGGIKRRNQSRNQTPPDRGRRADHRRVSGARRSPAIDAARDGSAEARGRGGREHHPGRPGPVRSRPARGDDDDGLHTGSPTTHLPHLQAGTRAGAGVAPLTASSGLSSGRGGPGERSKSIQDRRPD